MEAYPKRKVKRAKSVDCNSAHLFYIHVEALEVCGHVNKTTEDQKFEMYLQRI